MVGMTKYCPLVFFKKLIILKKYINGMSKIHSHINSIVSSLLCERPFYDMLCTKIYFEESN